MSRRKVYVAILNQGTVSAGWESQVYQWMLEKTDKYVFNLELPTDRPIPSNRHSILKDFLSGDWEFLVMLDNDNPAHKNIFDLLDLDLPVVGGVYPGKTERGITFFATRLVEENGKKVFKQYPVEERVGLKKVDGIATGLIVIQRWVLEQVLETYPHPFEDIFDEDGVLLYSDDFGFCLKCKELGIDVYAHFGYTGSHYKVVDLWWVGNLVAYAAQTGKTTLPERKVPKGEDSTSRRSGGKKQKVHNKTKL